MATIIQHKRSASASTPPGTGDLSLGELSINTNDGKLYLKKDDGAETVVEVGTTPSQLLVNDTLDFPVADGSANEVLATDGSGNIDFVPSSITTTIPLSTTTANQILLSVPTSVYGIKVFLSATHASAGNHVTEVVLTNNGSSTLFAQYGDIYTQSELFTLSADVNTGNSRLLITPANTNTTVKLSYFKH